MQVTILGTGMVGSAIVRDLAQNAEFEIIAADLNQDALDKLKEQVPVKTAAADLTNSDAILPLIADSNLVVSAVPGSIGYNVLKNIIQAGKNVVDISFFIEDPFNLDSLAKQKGVTAIVDCGVAPGLCNILAGYADMLLDSTESYICYVGGLPVIRKKPYEYKAVFSPADVLEEYTRPARLVEAGKEIVRPALSETELIDFEETGTLEAFNTDGLRSLIKTMDIPFMKEKTLRYPDYANLMRIFRDSGFLDTTPVKIKGQDIVPLDFTSKLLFSEWKLEQGEEDFTIMEVEVKGIKNNKTTTYKYKLFDVYDKKSNTTSMARTTGYTCAIAARQVINGLFTEKGIRPPEFIGRSEKCYQNLLAEYEKRNIKLKQTIIH